MTPEDAKKRESALAAFHGKSWNRRPPVSAPLHVSAGVPETYYGHPGREFQLFAAWRPLPNTVRKLLTRYLCPLAFQSEQLRLFRICWATPSVAQSDVLDPGTRLYNFTPKETREVWNTRYSQWIETAWLAAIDPYLTQALEVRGVDRVWLTEYTHLLERCLADPAWLSKASDLLFRNPQCQSTSLITASSPDGDSPAESASPVS